MKSQKEISFIVISSLRDQGKSDSEILLIGPSILLEEFRKGEWVKTKGGRDSDQDILSYSRSLLKNWLKKDERLNDGVKYVPKNPRGPRVQDEVKVDLSKSWSELMKVG